ncbi:uncharacterized protein MYCFIDRAFT_195285 [Pseudocercospora fijiensis CIRAD86]|uniref:Opioid growth factor receptor (OGFr) conserved domain-containing protein n=1 Tax=Pseudocercospora fijiensis (strain CIRAD86) TaxID=383855 RepID=M3B473_PSEFD|nr:uncharacterized protein MYCFIDRAFT_195285 [Pseudocercospora fijiensis CIRAD86]EME84152.1 hypothetical protein MYCFIDRAFT_195285 [Pseudocercospora fijiensis CIRAD86]
MTSDTTPSIVRFYGPEKAKDSEGRTLDNILQFNDRALEYHHDYIQVLFPLPERSPINPHAPIITKAVRDAFAQDEDLREQLFTAFKRMADFYAFDLTGTKDVPKISPKADNFKKLASNSWLTSMDHNHLRITRIIRCLRVLGLEPVARGFYEALKKYEEGRVSRRSLMYWQRAAERPLHLPPDESNDDAAGVAWLRD